MRDKSCNWMAFANKNGRTALSADEPVVTPRRKRMLVCNGLMKPSLDSSSSLLRSADSNNDAVKSEMFAASPFDIHNFHGITTSNVANDVLSTQDIVNGAILACALAFGYSYLNGQSTSSSFISWPTQTQSNNHDDDSIIIDASVQQGNNNKTLFDADDWREMSKKENYILYNTKIRRRTNEGSAKSLGVVEKRENKMILVALLLLFVPIFSAEFFFALSRQFMCEMGNEVVSIRLCSPAL